MYHKVPISKLSHAQILKLLRGHRIRVKHGSGHELHLSHEQAKRVMAAHRKGAGCCIEFCPWQIEQHQHLKGKGVVDVAKRAIKQIGPSAIDWIGHEAKNLLNGLGKKKALKFERHDLDVETHGHSHGHGMPPMVGIPSARPVVAGMNSSVCRPLNHAVQSNGRGKAKAPKHHTPKHHKKTPKHRGSGKKHHGGALFPAGYDGRDYGMGHHKKGKGPIGKELGQIFGGIAGSLLPF